MDTERPQRKRKTLEHLEKTPGERDVDGGLRYGWRKIEVTAQDIAGYRRSGLWPTMHWE